MQRDYGLYFPIVIDSDGGPAKPLLLDSIAASIRHILAYPKWDRYFLPSFGAGLQQFLGLPLSHSTLDVLRMNILLNLTEQEPRIEVQSIHLTPHSSGVLTIAIEALIKELRIVTVFETSA